MPNSKVESSLPPLGSSLFRMCYARYFATRAVYLFKFLSFGHDDPRRKYQIPKGALNNYARAMIGIPDLL